jgi:hypothetical protein
MDGLRSEGFSVPPLLSHSEAEDRRLLQGESLLVSSVTGSALKEGSRETPGDVRGDGS